jgi:TetR/AcrR family transcriptional repressor of nem operon
MTAMNAPNTDTQQRILDAARELIYARSYADVGVAEICESAGVQKGSFYHFFPSKRDLTLAVLDAQYLYFKEQLIDRAFVTDIPPLARLERFATLIYEFQQQVMLATGRVLGCPVGNLANEMASHDEPIRERIDQIFRKAQAQVRLVLKEADQAGELPGVNLDATAQAMFAYFEGVMMLAKTQNDPEVLRKLLPAMAQIRIPSRR